MGLVTRSLVISYINDRSNAVVLLWFSVACFCCQSFAGDSPCVCLYWLVPFGLLSGSLLGTSCFTICYLCVLAVCDFVFFPVSVLGDGFGF